MFDDYIYLFVYLLIYAFIEDKTFFLMMFPLSRNIMIKQDNTDWKKK